VNNAINLDLGPQSTFLGYTTQVDGEKVCVLSSRAASDRAIQARVRLHMKAQGRDCRSCGGCPVGQAS
jgi:hypothetical protein